MEFINLENELQIEIFEKMLEDMAHQESIYTPTNFWLQASNPIIEDIKKHGFHRFRELPSMRRFFVPTYGFPGNGLSQDDLSKLCSVANEIADTGTKKHKSLMHMFSGESWALADYRVYSAANLEHMKPDISGFTEAKIGNPTEHFNFENRWFSRSALNYLNGLSFLKQQINTGLIKSVLEIGGGFGSLGEILYQAGEYTYINVDIPPTAAVSTYYLSQIPKLNMMNYLATREMDEIVIPQKPTQMVLCPWQLPKLSGAVDLFVNFISFQEMEPAVVRNYLNHVDRLEAKYILLRNLREGKPVKSSSAAYGVETPILGSDYDSFLQNYRLVATNVFPFGYKTIDGFHSELRLYRHRLV